MNIEKSKKYNQLIESSHYNKKEKKIEGGLRTKGYSKQSLDDNPLISIITVVFNGEKYLDECIQSVINQSYENIEYIIIDGGSTDSSIDIIKKYQDEIDYWVSEKDDGIYDAWNKAVTLSTGEWLAFLGADDFYLTHAIKNYVKYINHQKTQLDYISSKVELIDNNKKKIKEIGKSWSWSVFKKYMNVAHVGSLHHKSYFREFGLYDSTYIIAGDYELLLRKRENLCTGYIDTVTAKMRVGGVSNNMVTLAFKETLNAKITSGQQPFFRAKFEYFLSFIKYFVRTNIFLKH